MLPQEVVPAALDDAHLIALVLAWRGPVRASAAAGVDGISEGQRQGQGSVSSKG